MDAQISKGSNSRNADEIIKRGLKELWLDFFDKCISLFYPSSEFDDERKQKKTGNISACLLVLRYGILQVVNLAVFFIQVAQVGLSREL